MVKKLIWILLAIFLLNVGFGFMAAGIYNNRIETLESHMVTMKAMMVRSQDIRAQYYHEQIALNKYLQLHTYLECKRLNVDYEVVLSMMYVESRFDTDAINTSNSNGSTDHGLMQINDVNLDQFYDMGFDNIMNPYQNISFGIYLLSERMKTFNKVEYAVASYNLGVSGFYSLMDKGQDYTQYSLAVMKYKKEALN